MTTFQQMACCQFAGQAKINIYKRQALSTRILVPNAQHHRFAGISQRQHVGNVGGHIHYDEAIHPAACHALEVPPPFFRRLVRHAQE